MPGYYLRGLAVNFFPYPCLLLLIELDIRNVRLSCTPKMFGLLCFFCVKQDEENFSTSRSKQANVVKRGSFYTINDSSGESDLLVLSTKVTRNLHLADSKHSVPLPTNSVGTITAKETNLNFSPLEEKSFPAPCFHLLYLSA